MAEMLTEGAQSCRVDDESALLQVDTLISICAKQMNEINHSQLSKWKQN